MSRSNGTLSYFDKLELRQAEKRYERAVRQSAMFQDPRTAHIHEAAEKRAFARLMVASTRCSGR